MSTISCAVVSSYLESYYDEFRREYDRLTAPPPAGGGFPRVGDHPAFDNLEVQCFLGTDGCVICDESGAPEYEWRIAGGPALMIDQEPTRVPKEIIQILRDQGLYGKNIGIYRVVSKSQIPDNVWRGIFPPFQDISIRTTPYGKKYQ